MPMIFSYLVLKHKRMFVIGLRNTNDGNGGDENFILFLFIPSIMLSAG